MKSRLYVFAMFAMVLFAPLLGVKASLPPGLLGDVVIQIPDPIFEAVVRGIIEKTTGDITANDVAEITSLDVKQLGIMLHFIEKHV